MTSEYLVVEAIPLKGVPEKATYFEAERDAVTYARTRTGLFGQVEVLLVLWRFTTQLKPETTEESQPAEQPTPEPEVAPEKETPEETPVDETDEETIPIPTEDEQ